MLLLCGIFLTAPDVRPGQETQCRAQGMFEDLSQQAPGTKSLEALQAIYNRLRFAQYNLDRTKSRLGATHRLLIEGCERASIARRRRTMRSVGALS